MHNEPTTLGRLGLARTAQFFHLPEFTLTSRAMNQKVKNEIPKMAENLSAYLECHIFEAKLFAVLFREKIHFLNFFAQGDSCLVMAPRLDHFWIGQIRTNYA